MNNTVERKTSLEVRTLLPKVLIDYLWDLVEQVPEAGSHRFLLTRNSINGYSLQEILHVWEGQEDREWHRVFGFPPVTASVYVTREAGCFYMRCTGSPDRRTPSQARAISK